MSPSRENRYGSHAQSSADHPQTVERNRALGQAVRHARKRMNLSQEKLALRVGCDRQSINRLENAAYSTSIHRLFCVADALDTTVHQLLTEVETPARWVLGRNAANERYNPANEVRRRARSKNTAPKVNDDDKIGE